MCGFFLLIYFPSKRAMVSIANSRCLGLPAIGFCSKNGRLTIAKQVFSSMSKSSDSSFLNVSVVFLRCALMSGSTKRDKASSNASGFFENLRIILNIKKNDLWFMRLYSLKLESIICANKSPIGLFSGN